MKRSLKELLEENNLIENPQNKMGVDVQVQQIYEQCVTSKFEKDDEDVEDELKNPYLSEKKAAKLNENLTGTLKSMKHLDAEISKFTQ